MHAGACDEKLVSLESSYSSHVVVTVACFLFLFLVSSVMHACMNECLDRNLRFFRWYCVS